MQFIGIMGVRVLRSEDVQIVKSRHIEFGLFQIVFDSRDCFICETFNFLNLFQ